MAVVLALLTASGCSPSAKDAPDVLGPGSGGPPPGSGGGGGVGTSTGGATADLLAGSWQNVMIVRFSNDIVTFTTTWDFTATGGCRKTAVSFSLIDGFPRTLIRDCRFEVRNFSIAVTYAGDAAPVLYSIGLVGFSADRLLLSGVEFMRLR